MNRTMNFAKTISSQKAFKYYSTTYDVQVFEKEDGTFQLEINDYNSDQDDPCRGLKLENYPEIIDLSDFNGNAQDIVNWLVDEKTVLRKFIRELWY